MCGYYIDDTPNSLTRDLNFTFDFVLSTPEYVKKDTLFLVDQYVLWFVRNSSVVGVCQAWIRLIHVTINGNLRTIRCSISGHIKPPGCTIGLLVLRLTILWVVFETLY